MTRANRIATDNPYDLVAVGEVLLVASRLYDDLGDDRAAQLRQQVRQCALTLGERPQALPDHLRFSAEWLLALGGGELTEEDARIALRFAEEAASRTHPPTCTNWRIVGQAQLALDDDEAALASFERAMSIAKDEREIEDISAQIATIRARAGSDPE